MLMKLEGDTIIQQYIFAYGCKASFIRFLYHNPKSYSSKVNSAILVTNKHKIMKEDVNL